MPHYAAFHLGLHCKITHLGVPVYKELNHCHHRNFLCTTLLPNFYPVILQYSSSKHVFSSRVKNTVDPDQMASSEAIDEAI